MNRSNIIVTRTGMQIGAHYVPPPQPMGEHAEIIQLVLLEQAPVSRFERVLDWLDAHWLLFIALAAAIGGILAEVVK